MSFYEPYSPFRTNFLNIPLLPNSNSIPNDYYFENINSMVHFDINTNPIYENIAGQYSDGSCDCSEFPEFPEEMFNLISTNAVVKSECHEDMETYNKQQTSIDNSLQFLQQQDGDHTNVDIGVVPSSPKSVISCLSSTHSTVSEPKKRIHQCNYCNRSFVRKHDLIRHKRIHTGIKPYQCPCCLKSFSRSDARRHHFRKVAACRDGAEKLPRRRK